MVDRANARFQYWRLLRRAGKQQPLSGSPATERAATQLTTGFIFGFARLVKLILRPDAVSACNAGSVGPE